MDRSCRFAVTNCLGVLTRGGGFAALFAIHQVVAPVGLVISHRRGS